MLFTKPKKYVILLVESSFSHNAQLTGCVCMSVLLQNYTDYQVLIYDLDGNLLIETVVTSHEKLERQIQVAIMPPKLKVNDDCRLLILTSPAPCEFLGKIKRFGGMYTIALFRGQVKENRAAARYKVSAPATIYSYLYNMQSYELHTGIKVKLINISTSGLRFRAPFNALTDGDLFRINMVVSDMNKSMNVEVLNHLDDKPDSSDYGGRFIE